MRRWNEGRRPCSNGPVHTVVGHAFGTMWCTNQAATTQGKRQLRMLMLSNASIPSFVCWSCRYGMQVGQRPYLHACLGTPQLSINTCVWSTV